MSTYPTSNRSAFVLWCQSHAPVFVDHAAEIGLGETQADDFDTATQYAKAALMAQARAQQAAAVATQNAKAAMASLKRQAGQAVQSIRAFAQVAESPMAVYATARIPQIAAPSPVPPPAQPKNLDARLDATTGFLTLRWKAVHPTNARGTSYIIRRKLPGETAFSFIGVAGKKTFVDDTLTAGAHHAQYTVQAQRASLSGPVSAALTVHFGKPGKTAAKQDQNAAEQPSHTNKAGRDTIEIIPTTGNRGRGTTVMIPTTASRIQSVTSVDPRTASRIRGASGMPQYASGHG